MFELTTPTAATLKSVTPRTEHHGDSLVVAVSMRLLITGSNTLLDKLSPKLRPAFYEALPDQEQLPGVEPSTPLLRAGGVLGVVPLKATFEGWTFNVSHGVDEEAPITIGGCKVDDFKLEAMEGGSIKLSFRIGSNDVDDEEIGILCGKLGSEITFTLIAPEVKEEAPVIDGTTAAFERDHPDAGALFAAEHGDDGLDSGGTGADSEGGETDISGSAEGWPFPKNAPGDAPPQSATVENSRPGTRTARGRDKTKAALAAGAAAAGVDA